MTDRRRRKGFTLAEMLVTVSIIAVLAAVVVPSVAGSLFKGDAGRVVSDLTNTRSAIEQFLSDVRRYPGRTADLTTALVAANTDINTTAANSVSGPWGVAYGTTAATRWRGPYLNSSPSQTGFGGTIATTFMRVDCANGSASSTPTTTTVTGTGCLAIVVTGLTQADARRVDFAMDDSVETKGMIRFKVGAALTDSLFFLVSPLQ